MQSLVHLVKALLSASVPLPIGQAATQLTVSLAWGEG